MALSLKFQTKLGINKTSDITMISRPHLWELEHCGISGQQDSIWIPASFVPWMEANKWYL